MRGERAPACSRNNTAALAVAPVKGRMSRNNLNAQWSYRIELAGKVLALMAALLPVAGFVARATAFEITFHDSGWAIPMAWSASLPDLAFTGLWSECLTAPVLGLLWLLYWALPPPIGLDRGLRLLHGRLRPVVILSAVALIAIVVLEPFWPAEFIPLFFAVTLVAYRRWRGGQAGLLDIWWVIVTLALISAVGDGVGGILGGYPQTAEYHFGPAAETLVADGRYQQYGEASGFVYLQRCGTSDIYIVNENEMESIRPPSQRPIRTAQNLLDVVFGAAPSMGAYKCQ